MGRKNLFILSKTSGSIKKGFTLIELLVALAMVGIMVAMVIFFMDPFKQLEKARDAQRVQDFRQVLNALDTYYNDNSSYPTSLSFGSSWNPYMQKLPQNPDCSSGVNCYGYLTDISNPQWSILFTKLYNLTNVTNPCPLEQLTSCLPTNYAAKKYNYCVISGSIDTAQCSYISTHSVP